MINSHARSRETLNQRWRRLALLAALVVGVVVVGIAMRWERNWYVSVNWTESLTHWAFIVDRTAEPVVGDYVEFVPPENRYYKNINFVKQIIAGPGDVVVCDGRRFFLDGELIATAKTHSQGGYPLTLGPCGEIPEGQYFVVTPHKDSFDSRYGEIGYVARTHILGVARPIL